MVKETYKTKFVMENLTEETKDFKECQETVHELMIKVKNKFPNHDMKRVLMDCVNLSKIFNDLINKSIVGETAEEN